MKTNKPNKLRKHIINTTVAIAVSIIITFIFAGYSASWQSILLNVSYGLIIGLSIAVGCGLISTRIFRNVDWMENPIRKFVIAMLIITTYIIIDVIVVNMIWFHITQGREYFEIFQHNFFIWIILTELVIGIIIYLIILSANFTKTLSAYYIDAEKTKHEVDKYKYATLKNQVNPHFLFNSLNVLSGMIYKDVDKADNFIGKLANIYRYVLDVQDEEVVSLNQEISFVEDYLFLQSIRFGNNLKYSINAKSEKMIIPMALQILVENAIKHNIISEESQLEIRISSDDRYIIISNNLNPKLEKEESHELGLENIKGRYKYLSDENIQIEQSADTFEIRLPLLSLKA